ncbi:MAG: oligosaccharide flippase family protein [Planctomycetota bacterium]
MRTLTRELVERGARSETRKREVSFPSAPAPLSLKRRYALSLFWSLAGSVVARGMTVATGYIVARTLAHEQFGEFGIILSTAAMFQVLAGVGMGMTATKHVAQFRTSDPNRAGRIIGLACTVSLVSGMAFAAFVFVAAPWLAIELLAAPHMAPLLRIASMILLFGTMEGAVTGALAGFEAFKTMAGVSLAAGLVSFPLIAGGVYMAGLPGAVTGLAAAFFVSVLFNGHALLRLCRERAIRISFREMGAEKSIFYRFSLPLVFAGMLGNPVFWACNILLVQQQGGYGQMALMNAANYWRSLLLFVPSVVNRIVVPMVSHLAVSREPGSVFRILGFNIGLNLVVAAVPVAAIMLFADTIMAGYGPEFVAGKGVLLVLAASAIPAAIVNSVKEVFVALGRAWLYLGFVVFWSAALLVASYLWVGQGAFGLANANLFAYLLLFVVEMLFVVHFVRVFKREKREG